ncbi:MAG: TolC family protein [Hymenobacter sp.]
MGEIKSAGPAPGERGRQRGRQLQAPEVAGGLSGFSGAPLQGTTLTAADIAAAQGGQAVTLSPAYGEAGRCRPTPLAFGLQYAGNTSASRLASCCSTARYLIGLKAAKVYEELAKKQTQQAEIDVVEQVSKAYYSTLVARSRLALLGRNVQRLDTVLLPNAARFSRPALPKSSTWTACRCSATTWWWSSRKPSASPS